MRRSTVLSFPLQLAFPGSIIFCRRINDKDEKDFISLTPYRLSRADCWRCWWPSSCPPRSLWGQRHNRAGCRGCTQTWRTCRSRKRCTGRDPSRRSWLSGTCDTGTRSRRSSSRPQGLPEPRLSIEDTARFPRTPEAIGIKLFSPPLTKRPNFSQSNRL